MTVPVDERFGSAVSVGKKVTVGVRPHDFTLAGEGVTPVATLKVEIVEALGFEAFAHGWLTSSGPRVIVRVAEGEVRRAKEAGSLPLTVDPARVHLFDASTGVTLAPAT
jgi:ABC-type sugar transport system ATPase subunit